MISRRHLMALASAAGVAAAASACTDTSQQEKQSAAPPASDAGNSQASGSNSSANVLANVKVSGQPGKEPKISLAKPLEFTGYHSKIVTPGTGAQVKQGNTIVTRSAIFDAEKGDLLASRWQDKSVGIFAVDEKTVGAQAASFFSTVKVGTRYLMAGEVNGRKVVEVGDLVGVARERAEGRQMPVSAPLPAITLGKDGNPQLKGKPEGKAPTSLTAATSIEGTGAVAKNGDTLVMHYRGWEWDTGKEFDSSWGRGEPFSFTLGKGEVIKGWDTALAGKKEGSQIVMAIPPNLAYGDQGELAGKTLLFVADILYVASPAA